jgi:hypothetical protein
MQITITLTPEQVESVDAYRKTQTYTEPHPGTTNLVVKYTYESVQEVISKHVGVLIANCTQQYPPASQLAKLEQIKQLMSEVAASALPSVTVEPQA